MRCTMAWSFTAFWEAKPTEVGPVVEMLTRVAARPKRSRA